jgi:NADH pyrophosphatase NudC (nudix superfamily)
MTVLEAIDRIQKILDYMESLNADEEEFKDIEALRMAIKALQTEQNAYKEGYDACKRIMAREKNFNHYCPNCGKKMAESEE